MQAADSAQAACHTGCAIKAARASRGRASSVVPMQEPAPGTNGPVCNGVRWGGRTCAARCEGEMAEHLLRYGGVGARVQHAARGKWPNTCCATVGWAHVCSTLRGGNGRTLAALRWGGRTCAARCEGEMAERTLAARALANGAYAPIVPCGSRDPASIVCSDF